MADAIAESAETGTSVIAVLHRLAHTYGRHLGDAAVGDQPPRTDRAALDLSLIHISEPTRQESLS